MEKNFHTRGILTVYQKVFLEKNYRALLGKTNIYLFKLFQRLILPKVCFSETRPVEYDYG